MKKALITGITGQDGSYLAELLIEKGYEVHGLVRRASTFNRGRIDHLCGDIHEQKAKLQLHYGDLTEMGSIMKVISKILPHEVYHLGAQSHVGISFEMPEFTANATGLSTIRILEAIRHVSPRSRFYQASSSEMFGGIKEIPQKETTPFYPRSPYAVAKVFAFWSAVNYRESYNMHISNGILFNHESSRRGENFVSRKITLAAAKIIARKKDCLFLGNLDAARDWGYAPEYVEGMWRMLQQDEPGDYILATNENHTVREFTEETFRLLGIELVWTGRGDAEKGIDQKTGKVLVQIDPLYVRPAEVWNLRGDYSHAKNILGWEPKVSFKELVKIMLFADLKREGIEL